MVKIPIQDHGMNRQADTFRCSINKGFLHAEHEDGTSIADDMKDFNYKNQQEAARINEQSPDLFYYGN